MLKSPIHLYYQFEPINMNNWQLLQKQIEEEYKLNHKSVLSDFAGLPSMILAVLLPQAIIFIVVWILASLK